MLLAHAPCSLSEGILSRWLPAVCADSCGWQKTETGCHTPTTQAVFGPAPANPLVHTLQHAGAAGDWVAVAQHGIASGVLGPLWEEVRVCVPCVRVPCVCTGGG